MPTICGVEVPDRLPQDDREKIEIMLRFLALPPSSQEWLMNEVSARPRRKGRAV
jgi:hypothetical protein